MLQAAATIQAQSNQELRKEKLSAAYQRRKLATKLEHAGWGNQLSKVISDLVAQEHGQPLPAITQLSDLSWTQLQLFYSKGEGDLGDEILQNITEYQNQSLEEVDLRVRAA